MHGDNIDRIVAIAGAFATVRHWKLFLDRTDHGDDSCSGAASRALQT
jgi:hypothetical protein